MLEKRIPMKITAYEVRPDEKDYLLAAAQQEQIEITLVQGADDTGQH